MIAADNIFGKLDENVCHLKSDMWLKLWVFIVLNVSDISFTDLPFLL